MTIYVHFNPRIAKAPIRLHNVASVTDAGINAIDVRLLFTDGKQRFEAVSHVAVTPERE